MTRSSPAALKQRSRPALRLRELRSTDRAPLEAILRATDVFNEAEIAIALELIDAPASAGYRFIVAEIEAVESATQASEIARNAKPRAGAPRVAGYACFGATPLTQGTYDLYWIAVDPALHGSGVGQALMRATEDALRAEGGRLMLIETASKPSYDKTRAFYVHWGCTEVARIPDFYAVGDDKVVYARKLDGAA
jgi:ribosomal protein S18 acetylase RimI-like enzyme